jgi:hypothetical protein
VPRNITDEQVEELALDLVRGVLEEGVEFLSISESIDNFLFDIDADVDNSTNEDLMAVRNRTDEMLTKLGTMLDNL